MNRSGGHFSFLLMKACTLMKALKMSPTIPKAVLLILLTNVGCGGGSTVPFTDDSQNAEKYAASVKQIVSDECAAAQTSSEPADQISTIVALLESPDNRPSGPHEAIYLEILAAAQKLNSECNAAQGRPEGLEQSLTDLKAIADKLPGTVAEKVDEDGQGGSMPGED
jgi:hypothetical protein